MYTGRSSDRRFLKPVSDALTSNVSTFPYSAEESARFTKLVRPYQGKEMDGHVTCVVARLNSFIGPSVYHASVRWINEPGP